MNTVMAIGALIGSLVAVPARAQNQGGDNLGNVLQGIGRFPNGQENPPPHRRGYQQRIYQRTNNDSVR